MKLILDDCLQGLYNIESDSIDSLITDPPAGISFMGKDWDEDKGGRDQWIAWMRDVMRECLRVLKPGAHGLVWAIPRTSHWTATALEDAGFEVRDVITHIFGSGFPKSLDIGKAIDKAMGAEREVIGEYKRFDGKSAGLIKEMNGGSFSSNEENQGKIAMVTAPATPEAKQWQGWGTALKPASEHWILVRKPISGRFPSNLDLSHNPDCLEVGVKKDANQYKFGNVKQTIAANVLKHGTGGLNIDQSRITVDPNDPNHREIKNKSTLGSTFGSKSEIKSVSTGASQLGAQGRFPANLVLSHNPDCLEVCTPGCAVAELDEQSGISKSTVWLVRKPLEKGLTIAANVLKHGTGALNIDESRIGTGEDRTAGGLNKGKTNNGTISDLLDIKQAYRPTGGRFPSNLVLSHNPDCLEVGVKKVKAIRGGGMNNADKFSGGYDAPKVKTITKGDEDGTETVPSFECTPGCAVAELDRQSGPCKTGPSRFFYCAKASRADKGKDNVHPTVKSSTLMSYLIKLVTPPDGVVLDPFMGSGSTGVAAIREGFSFIGIEREEQYYAIAQARIASELKV